MKIALAAAPYPLSINDGLTNAEKLIKEAAQQQAEIVCFPESYLPGYPGLGFIPEQGTPGNLNLALEKVCAIAAENSITVIMPMDWYTESGVLNLAYVISDKGEVAGSQTKNQLDPSEDNIWVPGIARSIFEVNGVKFGIVICHEGFRYPELTRWAARQGAQIVFHPHLAGNANTQAVPTQWGSMDNHYYEKAMMMRALENTIYFASVNYGIDYPESASSVIAPDGKCLAYQPYGKPGVLVVDIDVERATALLANRFKPQLLI